MTRKRRRIARGVYRDRWGVSATVKVDGTQREKRFPIGTALQKIRDWQGEDARCSTRLCAARAARQLQGRCDSLSRRGAGDAQLPGRERDIGFWIAEFGGEGRRDSITTKEMVSVLQRWEQKGCAASTMNHRRGALMHLWSRSTGGTRTIPSHAPLDTRKPRPEPRGPVVGRRGSDSRCHVDVGQPVAGQVRDDASKTKARLASWRLRASPEATETTTPGGCVLARIGDQGTSPE